MSSHRNESTKIASRFSRRRFAHMAGIAGGGLLAGAGLPRSASAQPSGTVKFFMVAGASEEPAWRGLVDAFNAQNMGVTVEFELMFGTWDEMYRKLRGYIEAGDSPDLVRHMATGIATWSASGELEDLNPYIARDGFSLDPFFPSPFEALTLDGKLWGMPPGIYTTACFYNKELFQQAGITAPTDWANPWTFDDLRSAALEMTSGEGPRKQFGMSVSMSMDLTAPYLWSNGGDIVNAERTKCVINEPAAVEALQFQRDLIHEDNVAPTPTDTQTIPASELFNTGRVAIMEGGPWLIPSMQDSGVDWGVMPYAKGAGDPATVSFIDYYAIQSASQNKDAAWEVLKFFMSAEAEQILADNRIGGVPARTDIAEQNADAIFERDGQVWIGSLAVARAHHVIRSQAEAVDAYTREIDLVRLNEKSVQEAADAVAAQVDALIAEEQSA